MEVESGRDDDLVRLVLSVARALREELGGEIEDQPGGTDPAGSGQANRALRAACRYLFGTVILPDHDPSNRLSPILKRAAGRRLAEGGLADSDVGRLVDRSEGGSRDDWFAFPLLTPLEEVEHLLGESESEVR